MGEYDDIIHLPHHVSEKHPQMPMMERAAQFAPFAALTGYGAVIKETARLTEKQVELEEYDQEQLNRKLTLLLENVYERPELTVSFFCPDDRKDGGSYKSLTARLKKIDTFQQILILEDGTRIPFANIIDIAF